MTTAESHYPMGQRPWYIHDQRWSVLILPESERHRFKGLCQPKFYRSTADGVANEEMVSFQQSFAMPDHVDEIALNRFSKLDSAGRPIDLRFMAIIADSGVGKSALTEWLEYRINQPDSRAAAFRFDLKSLVQKNGLTCGNVRKTLPRVITDIWYHRLSERTRGSVTVDRLREHVVALMRRAGELCLIFDGLDQCSTTELEILGTIVSAESFEFKGCRFIVAGRPQAYTTHWGTLFSGNSWRLVRVESLTRAQQVRYLGWMADGSLRFNKIPRGARVLLSNPRILSYLRLQRTFKDIHNAADVYKQAVDYLVSEGMRRSDLGSRIGLASGTSAVYDSEKAIWSVNHNQIMTAIKLLAITAFETKRECQKRLPPTWTSDWAQTGKLPSRPENPIPAYDYNVPNPADAEVVEEKIKEHPATKKLRGSFESNWDGLATLNSGFLENSFFEDDRGGLKELVWSNKTLHEFLLAYYFANLASDEDTHYLWDWIYIKDQYATEDYYWFWQFLCEMPSEFRREEVWLRSIRMIYQPGIYTVSADGTRTLSHAKRSTEMIFRSWFRLQKYIEAEKPRGGQATEILSNWQGEFERFRSGEYGPEAKKTADDIVDHLMFIDLTKIGRFKMGTSPEKQGLDSLAPNQQQALRQMFASFQNDRNAITSYFDRFEQSKAMVDYRERTEPVWRQLAQRPHSETAFREWIAIVLPNNEHEVVYENLPNELFPNYSLGRHPVSNRFFRLFDPNYGLRGTGNPNSAIASNDLWPRYADLSDQPETPSIYLSFYDAWVYSRFLYWDGLSCHLPHEDQWECSAKYGFGWAQWDQAYWWGNDFDRDRDRERINCRETGNKKTLVPDSRRANPLTVIADPKEQGLIDMLGGLWEWCEDPCPNLGDSYRRHSAEMFADPSVARSLRGGSFYSSAFDARCSRRDHNDPSKAYRNFGCRVARAKP